MTLLPGDVIACGTSIGVGSMKAPTNTVTIAIEGIGELTNTYENWGTTTMRICVVGAGAIGGLLAAKLSQASNEGAGNDVTVIDQGARLAEIQRSEEHTSE